jgi:ABC-type Mn2+/Zn2+ transport system ATPase subunit
MRRRLSLARALATDGMLAVLDEPTEGLDVAGRKQVYAVMNDLASRGCSIVAFTDDPNIMKGVRFVLDLNTKPVPRLVDQTMGAEARARANQEQPKIGADDDSPSDAAEAPAAPSGGDAVATGNRTVRS